MCGWHKISKDFMQMMCGRQHCPHVIPMFSRSSAHDSHGPGVISMLSPWSLGHLHTIPEFPGHPHIIPVVTEDCWWHQDHIYHQHIICMSSLWSPMWSLLVLRMTLGTIYVISTSFACQFHVPQFGALHTGHLQVDTMVSEVVHIYIEDHIYVISTSSACHLCCP